MDAVVETLSKIGFQVIRIAKKNENGPDIWALKENLPYSFEVKHVKMLRQRCAQVPPVEPGRRSDDYIAVVFPSGYVLIEPMVQHLRNCSPKGYRMISGVA